MIVKKWNNIAFYTDNEVAWAIIEKYLNEVTKAVAFSSEGIYSTHYNNCSFSIYARNGKIENILILKNSKHIDYSLQVTHDNINACRVALYHLRNRVLTFHKAYCTYASKVLDYFTKVPTYHEIELLEAAFDSLNDVPKLRDTTAKVKYIMKNKPELLHEVRYSDGGYLLLPDGYKIVNNWLED